MPQIKITIEQNETVWKKTREYKQLSLDEKAENQFGYVDAELPQMERKILLEQTLPGENFDVKAVIKAVNGL